MSGFAGRGAASRFSASAVAGPTYSVGQSANIRSLNVYNDPDDVVRAASGFSWRELDSIRVQGRDEPISIYEPLALHGEETPEQKVVAAAYAHALACWRRRDFVRCAEALAPVAADPAPTVESQYGPRHELPGQESHHGHRGEHKIERWAEAVGPPAEGECADEQAEKQSGDETGKALQIEQALRGRREDAGLEQAYRR